MWVGLCEGKDEEGLDFEVAAARMKLGDVRSLEGSLACFSVKGLGIVLVVARLCGNLVSGLDWGMLESELEIR